MSLMSCRLDEETEELHHERVSLSLGKVMQQARQAKEWSQKDLSTVSFFFFISCFWKEFESFD